MSSTVVLERPSAGIVLITLNRPDRRNAVNAELIADFGKVLRELALSASDRVVVLAGAGKGFCSGMDQQASGYEEQTANGNIDGLLNAQRDIADLVLALRGLPQPVVVAVHGAAVGAGLAFALGGDIRLAGESSRFAVGAIRVGLAGADMGMSWHLPRVVGTSRAAEWLLTGRTIDADEAAQTGLVSRTIPDDLLLDAALATAGAIVANQDFAVRLTKRALWSSVSTPDLPTAMESENQSQVLAAARLQQVLADGPTAKGSKS